MHALLHQYVPFRTELHIDSRSELDHPDALAGSDRIARLLVEYDAARDQSGDLLKGHTGTIAVDGDRVLFILRRGFLFTGHQELSLLVADLRDFAGDGRAVHVDVEDIQEDADAGSPWSIGFHRHDFAVGGRDSYRTGRNAAIGVAKEIKAEKRQYEEGRCKPGP